MCNHLPHIYTHTFRVLQGVSVGNSSQNQWDTKIPRCWYKGGIVVQCCQCSVINKINEYKGFIIIVQDGVMWVYNNYDGLTLKIIQNIAHEKVYRLHKFTLKSPIRMKLAILAGFTIWRVDYKDHQNYQQVTIVIVYNPSWHIQAKGYAWLLDSIAKRSSCFHPLS